MIGRVKAGTFKYNSDRLEYLSERFFTALRAGHQVIICKFLFLVELHAAVLASVGIDWHTFVTLITYSFAIVLPSAELYAFQFCLTRSKWCLKLSLRCLTLLRGGKAEAISKRDYK